MSDIRGRFYWYELMTPDVEAAKAFYTKVVGWGIESVNMGENFTYDMFKTVEGTVAGVVNPATMPGGGENVPPHWLGYIGTPDVDATAARAKELGATVYAAPMDIPGVGRFAVLADPQGAVFALFDPGEDSPEKDPAVPGTFSWSELFTSDLEAAWSFYTELFSWKKTGGMDMGGDMGEYRLFGRAADNQLGGFMKKPADQPAPPHWLYYTTVEDLTGALNRVRELGGQVLWGPMEVPGGDTVATCMDPQGAAFAIFQKGKARAE